MPGKSKGTKNYKKELLLKALALVKPTCTDMWRKAYVKYQLLAEDLTEGEPEDVKRYFWETMCKKGVKPTGKAAPDPIVQRSVKVWASILQKNSMASYGGEDSSTGGIEENRGSSEDKSDEESCSNDDRGGIEESESAGVSALAQMSQEVQAPSSLFTPDRESQSNETKRKTPENDGDETIEKKDKKQNKKKSNQQD